ncbi:hypothetical protein BT67DRAFT_220582 [Trichocladium antarcticum]|uniref:Uncharacterized protein n=1 Tax=Trichocladium antarcticum TaxID=1450529 RepID=A0AAN6ZAB6_9PEZI|nr:hypothetical protein BT67DRAFT_220582 [Trichocladium antarcticum]
MFVVGPCRPGPGKEAREAVPEIGISPPGNFWNAHPSSRSFSAPPTPSSPREPALQFAAASATHDGPELARDVSSTDFRLPTPMLNSALALR